MAAMAMTENQLNMALHRIMAPDCDGASVLAYTDEGDGSGVVWWSRLDRGGVEHIVHRWFDHYSNGEPTADGVHLHSGFYTMDRDAAIEDFAHRGGERATEALLVRRALKGG